MTEGKWEKYASVCILAAFGTAAAWLAVRYLVPVLLPMVLGYGLAAWVKRMGRWVRRFTGNRFMGPVGERIGGMGMAVVLCVLLLWGGWRGLSALAGQAGELVSRAADLWDWETLPGWLREGIPPPLQERIRGTVTALVEKGAGWLAGAAGGMVSALPGAALAVLVTIASLFYWLADREGILAALAGLLPADWRKGIVGHPVWRKTTGVLGQAGRSVGGYLRAQVSLALVMFLILTAGLSLLGVHAPAAWGCLTALADLLPLVGAGVVLLPWAVFAFLTHRTGLGIGLAVLWLLLWFLRQWLEPRLVGRALGVHPYVMLAGLYAAYRLGGVGGMILAAAALGGVGEGRCGR